MLNYGVIFRTEKYHYFCTPINIKTMKTINYLPILAIAILVVSCVKQGPAGPQGENGANGVSNITATYYTVSTTDWKAIGTEWEYNTNQNVPNGDGVMVYVSTVVNVYVPLPAISTFYTSDNLTFNYGSAGPLKVVYSGSSNAPNLASTIEVVDFPPAIYVKYPNVNWANYAEVSALPEVQAALAKAK